jgi:ATP-dependent RNA helicase DDX24/MAK5
MEISVFNEFWIQIAIVVGGMAQEKQERMLKKCPEIVVATPGRFWELVKEGNPFLQQVDRLPYDQTLK